MVRTARRMAIAALVNHTGDISVGSGRAVAVEKCADPMTSLGMDSSPPFEEPTRSSCQAPSSHNLLLQRLVIGDLHNGLPIAPTLDLKRVPRPLRARLRYRAGSG